MEDHEGRGWRITRGGGGGSRGEGVEDHEGRWKECEVSQVSIQSDFFAIGRGAGLPTLTDFLSITCTIYNHIN